MLNPPTTFYHIKQIIPMMHAVVPPCAISPLGRGLAPKPINDRSFPRLSLCWRPQQRHRRTHNVVPTLVAAQDNVDAGNGDRYDRPTRILHQTSFNDWSKTYVNEKGILVCVCVRACVWRSVLYWECKALMVTHPGLISPTCTGRFRSRATI